MNRFQLNRETTEGVRQRIMQFTRKPVAFTTDCQLILHQSLLAEFEIRPHEISPLFALGIYQFRDH